MNARRLATALLVLATLAGLLLPASARQPRDASSRNAAAVKVTSEATENPRVARGRYLALAGNCAGCHTARGGEPYAGGRGIPTPFGTVYAGNLTPDPKTGIGTWSDDDFWRALHSGRSRDGRLLYPAFPYPSYTKLTREDADAIFAFLRTIAPVHQENRAHALRFPYDRQWALAMWRTLFFKEGAFKADPAQSQAWNRGAYLVQGLGHCDACHADRNLLGATRTATALAGGRIPVQGWDAPALSGASSAAVTRWTADDFVNLLSTGIARQGVAIGPMAEVVARSTQHLTDADIAAMGTYLASLQPQTKPAAPPTPVAAGNTGAGTADNAGTGVALYRQHCADCHGEDGEGRQGRSPALRGNQTLNLAAPDNAIRAVLSGGFSPSTRKNPRPYGMPPFAPFLNDAEIAEIVGYARQAWGNAAGPVKARDVGALRGQALR